MIKGFGKKEWEKWIAKVREKIVCKTNVHKFVEKFGTKLCGKMF